ncbi:MAG: DUF2207 domain-containing protein [Lachnospiraceae bacterium]|nr:DUF2207 domain-containing protein [Lachnospiraceae bacterium]
MLVWAATFVLSGLLPFLGYSCVASNDYVRITEVDYKAVIVDEPDSNGKIVITERLTYDIHAASRSNTFWELWRDLPETMTDGVLVNYKVNSVKQILADGSYIEYQESPKLYWDDDDYINTAKGLGPGKWFHSEGPYNENARQYECVLFYVNGLYRETVVFEIEYEMNNAALRYADSSELYIALYSGETVDYLQHFRGQILIPSDKMPQAGNYEAYTCGTSTNTFPFTESATANPGYHTFSFTLDEKALKFRPYNQYIEFVLISFGPDKHKFTQYASHNAYYDKDVLGASRYEMEEYLSEPGIWQKYKLAAFTVLLVATLLFTWLAWWLIERAKKKNAIYETAQDIEFYRDIPSDLDPCFAAELALCKGPKASKIDDGMAAALLGLLHKDYIAMERIRPEGYWKQSNMKIVVKPVPSPLPPPHELAPGQAPPAAGVSGSSPLSVTEQLYYDLIRRHVDNKAFNGEIALKAFQTRVSSDYEHTTSFLDSVKKSIPASGVALGYFQKPNYKKPQRQVKDWVIFYVIIGLLVMAVGNIAAYQTRLDLAFGGFFVFGLGCLANAVYLGIQASKLILLTQLGADEYAKWRGLYNFLNSETLMRERTFIEVVIWEKYLIYATAFGIAEKVIKALKVRSPEVANTSPVLRNTYIASGAYIASSRSFGTATRTASYASSSGGHGGYGGGGRGGGGGGGGH